MQCRYIKHNDNEKNCSVFYHMLVVIIYYFILNTYQFNHFI